MVVDQSVHLPLSQLLHQGGNHHPGEGNQLPEDEPDVDHLDVGRRRQLVHHRNEDGGHHQHGGQVHRHRGLKVKRSKEGGGVRDEDQED